MVINCFFWYFSTLGDLGCAASCLNHKLSSETFYRWNFRSFSNDEKWQEYTLASNWCHVFQFHTEPCTREFTPASQNMFGASNRDLSVWNVVLQMIEYLTLQVLGHSSTHLQQQRQEQNLLLTSISKKCLCRTCQNPVWLLLFQKLLQRMVKAGSILSRCLCTPCPQKSVRSKWWQVYILLPSPVDS